MTLERHTPRSIANGESAVRFTTRRLTWPLLVLTFIAVRISLLVASPLLVLNGEERDVALVARELLVGRAFPVFDYQYAPYGGGTLVMGLTATPVFWLFGPSHAALKLLALAWGTVVFAVWLTLFRRVLGREVAIAAGVFWAFAPLPLTRQSLLAWGNYSELGLFSGLGLLLLLTSAVRPVRHRRLAVVGALLGFAIYFTYLAVIDVTVVLLVALLLGFERIPLHRWWSLVGGFWLGFAPWILYNLQHSYQGLAIYGTGVQQLIDVASLTRPARRVVQLLGSLLMPALSPPPELGALHTVGGLALLVLLAVSFATCLRELYRAVAGGQAGSPRSLMLLAVVVQPGLLVLAYAFSRVGIWSDYHSMYTFRFLPILLPYFSAAFGVLVALQPRLRFTLCISPLLAVTSIVAVAVDDGPSAPRWLQYRGYAYRALCRRAPVAGGDLVAQLERAQAIRDPDVAQSCLSERFHEEARRRFDALVESGPVGPEEIEPLRHWASEFGPPRARIAQTAIDDELSARARRGQLHPIRLDPSTATEPLQVRLAIGQRCNSDPTELGRVITWIYTLDEAGQPAAWEQLGACFTSPEELTAKVFVLGPGAAMPPDAAMRAMFRGSGGRLSWRSEQELGAQLLAIDRVPMRFRRDWLDGVYRRVAAFADDPAREADLKQWSACIVGIDCTRWVAVPTRSQPVSR